MPLNLILISIKTVLPLMIQQCVYLGLLFWQNRDRKLLNYCTGEGRSIFPVLAAYPEVELKLSNGCGWVFWSKNLHWTVKPADFLWMKVSICESKQCAACHVCIMSDITVILCCGMNQSALASPLIFNQLHEKCCFQKEERADGGS